MDFPFDDAKELIDAMISSYQASSGVTDTCPAETAKGRMYELVVLSRLVRHLKSRGFAFQFIGKFLELKEKPGKINSTDPFFEGVHLESGYHIWIYTDIEVVSLSASIKGTSDNSRLHEVDIVVLGDPIVGNPKHSDILLGVECKSGAFEKSIIKEVLGVKRELSLLKSPVLSTLSSISSGFQVEVPSDPPMEFWLAHFDPKGGNYMQGPQAFGVELRNEVP